MAHKSMLFHEKRRNEKNNKARARCVWALALLFVFAIPRARAVWCALLTGCVLPLLSRLSGLISFPVTALLLCALIGALAARPKRAPRALLALACAFTLLWLPLYEAKPFPLPARADADAQALYTLCQTLGAHAGARYADRDLRADTLARAGAAVDALGLSRGAFSPPKFSSPKFTRFPEWMRAVRAAGMYIPLTGEALINPDEPTALIAFTACHEAAHARGVADEGQANIAAYLACTRAGGELAYSAFVSALRYALTELRALDPALAEDAARALYPGVAADLLRAGDAKPGAQAFGDYFALTPYLLSHPELV